jgi:uncharacterized protein involved in tolerance to divalent cations
MISRKTDLVKICVNAQLGKKRRIARGLLEEPAAACLNDRSQLA